MKYLGLDWGMKKIGVAVSEGDIASPLTTLRVDNFNQAISKAVLLINKQRAQIIIIGKPEGEMGRNVDRVVNELKKRGFEVIVADETLSSYDARQLLIKRGVSKTKRNQEDSLSAAIILQNYLDEEYKSVPKLSTEK